jgi:heterodisulfide reductase subunit C/nitrate reductase gamma subunit
MFDYLLYASLTIFLLGLICKISTWFTRNIGVLGNDITTAQRVRSAARGFIRTLFSSKIIALLEALLLDVFLQRRTLKESFTRWLAHMFIFYGFMLLVLMHGFQSVVSETLFYDYYPTVNPYLFLRDLFAAMVVAGVIMAVMRRYVAKPRRLRTGAMDHYAVIIVAVIILSGITLEGFKIASHAEFMWMVEDYGALDDEDEIRALEALWVKEYGLVSSAIKAPFEPELIQAGREVHESSCVDCHASTKWGFSGYAAAKIIKPAAQWIDRHNGVDIMWYIHIIACFAGLAYLPFSKMFHLIATPISLIANRVMDPANSAPANIITRQILELDACTHCGSCSLNCSVAMMYEAIGNENILPSEKMMQLKKLVSGKHLDEEQMRSIAEGVYLCTNCDRCTVHCPSGIRLKELWFSVREALLESGPPLPYVMTPYSYARGLIMQPTLPVEAYSRPIEGAWQTLSGRFADLTQPDQPIPLNSKTSGEAWSTIEDKTFVHCFSCQNCTTVCPVVGSYDNPEETLGLLPHQIMCSLGLGLKEMAAGARMIWDCVTCYKCQENCPQQVEVCDLLFCLKNVTFKAKGH